MKICARCSIEKDLDAYGVCNKAKDGKQSYCRPCKREAASTPEAKEWQKEYKRSDSGKIIHTKSSIKYGESNPNKIRAQKRLNNAVRDGIIERPDTCFFCDLSCVTDGHHWNYEEEYWLDVVWLCRSCHLGVHGNLKLREDR